VSARALPAAALVGGTAAFVVGTAALVVGTAAPLAAQDAAISAEVQLEVYATALGFYSPPRNQVRWIETTPLEPGVPAPLDPGLRSALIARLGDRFLPWSENAPGQGGRLRVTPIEPAGPGRYRLGVGYRHRTPYFEGSVSTQTFLVGCEAGDCQILDRGGGTAMEIW
jgi:hypothetical protein